MSSARRRRRGGSAAKKSENTADATDKWLHLVHTLTSANDHGSVHLLNDALVELSQLPLHAVSRTGKEVEADVLLMGGHLSLVDCFGSQEAFPPATPSHRSPGELYVAFCRIVVKALSRPNASLSVLGFKDLMRLVLQWAEQSLESTEVTQLGIDSVMALGAILNAFQAPVAVQTQASLQHVLMSLFTKHCCRPTTPVYARDAGRITLTVDLCRAVSDAAHALLSSRVDIQPVIVEKMTEGVVAILHRQKPVENPFLSGMYVSLLRTLTMLVSEGHGTHVPHVPSLMEVLPSFLGYGNLTTLRPASFSDSTSEISSSDAGSGGRYVPPQLRSSEGSSGYSSASSSNLSGRRPHLHQISTPCTLGSETSGGYSTRQLDHNKSAKVRLAVLTLVQKISQMDGKSLHPYWGVLLPFRQPLQRSPTNPHLVNVLLYDPHPQVRMTAAGTIAVLMEGRAQKGFLSVAELSSPAAIRGFNTLSVSLGRMVVALHEGVLHAIENEDKLSVIPHLFRTLNSLVSATRYDRMPSDLRTRMAKCIRKQWTVYHDQGDGDVAREAACMIALRTILSSMPPDPMLAEYLENAAHSLHDQSRLAKEVCSFVQGGKRTWSLLDALFAAAHSHPDVVRSESLAALTSAATNYASLFQKRWSDVARILDKNITQEQVDQSGPEEKAAQQSIRLFGALIADAALMEDAQLLEQSVAILPLHILPSITHSSAVLRSAALSEIGGATKAVLSCLSEDVLRRVLNAALTAAVEDPVVAVRSSACRMIGDMVNAGFYISREVLFGRTVSVLADCLENPTISVRISSSWSLANVADAIGRFSAEMLYIARDAAALNPLASAAIAASKDHEKVICSLWRRLPAVCLEDWRSTSWLEDAIACLHLSLQDGSAKVKWNACYATGSLALNKSLQTAVNCEGALTRLIGLLVHLVNENPNFKVQMQAAAALDNVAARTAFRDMFFSAISAVARRLHILQDGSQETLPEETGNEQLIQPTVDASFPNFKYHEGLKRQLEMTLLHLLSLLDGPFSGVCVFPRPEVLFPWLKRKVEATCTALEADCETKILLETVLRNLLKYEEGLADWSDLLLTVLKY